MGNCIEQQDTSSKKYPTYVTTVFLKLTNRFKYVQIGFLDDATMFKTQFGFNLATKQDYRYHKLR